MTAIEVEQRRVSQGLLLRGGGIGATFLGWAFVPPSRRRVLAERALGSTTPADGCLAVAFKMLLSTRSGRPGVTDLKVLGEHWMRRRRFARS